MIGEYSSDDQVRSGLTSKSGENSDQSVPDRETKVVGRGPRLVSDDRIWKKTYPVRGGIAHIGRSSWRQRKMMVEVRKFYGCIVSNVG